MMKRLSNIAFYALWGVFLTVCLSSFVCALSTVSKSFTDAGTSALLRVRHGERLTYAVSGTFVGTVHVDRTTNNGSTWEVIVPNVTTAASGTLLCETSDRKGANYRVRCSTYTSGTIVTALAEMDDTFQEFGAKGRSPVVIMKDESVSLVGNAATVTDGVYTTGSYADPAWITSIAASKVASIVAVATQTIAAAGTVTANQCGGVKRISSAGVVTSSTTTTFTSPTAGTQCLMAVCNVGANNITLDDNAGFKSYSAGNVVLTPQDCVDVAFDGVIWRQRAPVSTN